MRSDYFGDTITDLNTSELFTSDCPMLSNVVCRLNVCACIYQLFSGWKLLGSAAMLSTMPTNNEWQQWAINWAIERRDYKDATPTLHQCPSDVAVRLSGVPKSDFIFRAWELLVDYTEGSSRRCRSLFMQLLNGLWSSSTGWPSALYGKWSSLIDWLYQL